MFYKILIVIFLTLSIFIFTGEAYLRNFSSYGVEYFIEFELGVKKDVESELNFIPYDALDALLKGEKDSAYENNQNGLRACRIIVLGDSVACGGEMDHRELKFSDQMKEILRRNYPDVNFDVLVCAAGGWSTTQEVTAYRKYCQDIRHDLVILAYCQNDDAEAYQRIRRIGGRNVLAFYKTGVPYISLAPFNKFFTEKLLIARFINEHLIKLLQRCRLPFHIGYCLIRDDKIYLAFRKLYSLTKSKNIPVVVAVFPHLVEKSYAHDARMSDLIQRWCKELGWGYVNLQKPFKDYGLRALRINLKDDIHPNSLGHRIAAEAIAGELQETAVIKNIVNSEKN